MKFILFAILTLFSGEAFVAVFPTCIEKVIEVSPALVSQLLEVLGTGKSSMTCSLAEDIEIASVVAKTGMYRDSEDKRPQLQNLLTISADKKAITIGPYWLDHRTGYPVPKVPRYAMVSKPFHETTKEDADCWVRMNQHLSSLGKDQIRFVEEVPPLKRWFTSPQVIFIKRSVNRGQITFQLFIGPEL